MKTPGVNRKCRQRLCGEACLFRCSCSSCSRCVRSASRHRTTALSHTGTIADSTTSYFPSWSFFFFLCPSPDPPVQKACTPHMWRNQASRGRNAHAHDNTVTGVIHRELTSAKEGSVTARVFVRKSHTAGLFWSATAKTSAVTRKKKEQKLLGEKQREKEDQSIQTFLSLLPSDREKKKTNPLLTLKTLIFSHEAETFLLFWQRSWNDCVTRTNVHWQMKHKVLEGQGWNKTQQDVFFFS